MSAEVTKREIGSGDGIYQRVLDRIDTDMSLDLVKCVFGWPREKGNTILSILYPITGNVDVFQLSGPMGLTSGRCTTFTSSSEVV